MVRKARATGGADFADEMIHHEARRNNETIHGSDACTVTALNPEF